MTATTFSNSLLNTESSSGAWLAKALLLEPVLTAGAALFWLVALPFVALALMGFKVWETVAAVLSGRPLRPNPLMLRYAPVKAFAGDQVRAHAR
jgi:hypothetical protein